MKQRLKLPDTPECPSLEVRGQEEVAVVPVDKPEEAFPDREMGVELAGL